MKVVITDYQYENIDSERSIITGAGYELFDYQVKTTPDLIPVVKDARSSSHSILTLMQK